MLEIIALMPLVMLILSLKQIQFFFYLINLLNKCKSLQDYHHIDHYIESMEIF